MPKPPLAPEAVAGGPSPDAASIISLAASSERSRMPPRQEDDERLYRIQIDNDTAALANDERRETLQMRKAFSGKFFGLGVAWLICLFWLLVVQGFLSVHHLFYLSDRVLISIIAASSTVFGFLTIWAGWLFPRSQAQTDRGPASKRAATKRGTRA